MWTWLFATKTGRSVLLGGTIAITVGLAWWGFSSHYDGIGYARCQKEHADAIAKANVNQAEENEKRNDDSSKIAKDADKAGQTVVTENETKTIKTKEDIRDAYKKPPANAPIAFDSCVHAVAPGVQKRISEAVDSANGK